MPRRGRPVVGPCCEKARGTRRKPWQHLVALRVADGEPFGEERLSGRVEEIADQFGLTTTQAILEDRESDSVSMGKRDPGLLTRSAAQLKPLGLAGDTVLDRRSEDVVVTPAPVVPHRVTLPGLAGQGGLGLGALTGHQRHAWIIEHRTRTADPRNEKGTCFAVHYVEMAAIETNHRLGPRCEGGRDRAGCHVHHRAVCRRPRELHAPARGHRGLEGNQVVRAIEGHAGLNLVVAGSTPEQNTCRVEHGTLGGDPCPIDVVIDPAPSIGPHHKEVRSIEIDGRRELSPAGGSRGDDRKGLAERRVVLVQQASV